MKFPWVLVVLSQLVIFYWFVSSLTLFLEAIMSQRLTYLAYHDGRVPHGVLGYDHGVAFLFPLRRLVFHIGDGDGQFHRTAPVSAIRGHDLPGDVGPLKPRREYEMEWKKKK